MCVFLSITPSNHISTFGIFFNFILSSLLQYFSLFFSQHSYSLFAEISSPFSIEDSSSRPKSPSSLSFVSLFKCRYFIFTYLYRNIIDLSPSFVCEFLSNIHKVLNKQYNSSFIFFTRMQLKLCYKSSITRVILQLYQGSRLLSKSCRMNGFLDEILLQISTLRV